MNKSESPQFRFGVILEPPHSFNCSFQPNCLKRGFAVETALYVCQALSLNCTFEWYSNYDYGHFDSKSGHFTGLIGDIERNYYNSTLPVLMPNSERAMAVDFTSAFFHDTIVAFTRMPNEEKLNLDWAILRTFNWQIWISFLILFLALVILVSLIAKEKIGKSNDHRSFCDIIFSSFSYLLFMTEEKRRFDFISLRILMVIWGLVACTLSATYTGVLFNEKVVSVKYRPFTDIDSLVECVRTKQCRIVTPMISYASLQWVLQSRTTSGLRLQDVINDNPIEISPLDEIGSRILKSQDAYHIFITRGGIFNEATKNNRDCTFYSIKLPLVSSNSFPLHKNLSKLSRAFDRMAGNFMQFGMANYLERKYNLDVDLCQSLHGYRLKKAAKELSFLGTLLAAMIIHIICLSVALGIFFIEFSIYNYRCRPITQDSTISQLDRLIRQLFAQ